MDGQKSEFYCTIDLPDLRAVIPPDDIIVYSTVVDVLGYLPERGRGLSNVAIAPMAITNNGIALFEVENMVMAYAYRPLYEVRSLSKRSISVRACRYDLKYDTNLSSKYEDKKHFNERADKFVPRFRPIVIQKKKAWLAAIKDDPRFNDPQMKKSLKLFEEDLNAMMKDEEAWQHDAAKEEEKRLKKESKKK